METKKQPQNLPYMTPEACPPDEKNGSYMTFTSDEGTTTYFQVTNDLNLWLKTVSKEGFVINVTSFNGEAGQKMIEYIKFREKMVKEGRVIYNNTVAEIVE